jgi:isoquinoline 1-oxidoreductase subunit alpha
VLLHYTRGCGRIERPAFPRPLISEGAMLMANLAHSMRRDREAVSAAHQPSSPRRRGPSIPETPVMIREAAAYWIPAFAGMTSCGGRCSPEITATPANQLSFSQTQNLDLNCSSFPVQHLRAVQSMDWTNQGIAMANLTINGKTFDVDVEPDTPLLWVIRENVGLTGTKYGCGIAQCGACTVHIDGEAMRSCGVAVSEAAGKQITTIEGLAGNGALHKVQQAWVDNDVPQCGYCQSGMIMAVAALLKDKPKPTDADIDDAITNICRCGTFQQVREAIHAAANA